jgi:hypothetical protein
MSATAILTLGLFSDDEGTIQLQNFRKRAKDTSEKAVETGKQLDKSSGGFRAAGFASEKLAEEVGVSGRAANMLGDRVADMSRVAFPAYGVALGLASAATLALAGGIVYLINHKQQLREGLEKSVTAMTADMDQLYSSEQKTKALQRVTQEVAQAKRAELIAKEGNLIYETTEAYKKLTKELSFLREVQSGAFLDQAEGGGYGGLTNNIERIQNKAGESVAEINLRTEAQRLHLAEPDMGYAESERMTAVVSYNKTVTQIWQLQGTSFEQQMQAEKKDFEDMTEAKLAAMTNAERVADFTAQRRIELKAMMAQKTIDQAKRMNERQAAINSATLDGMQKDQARQELVSQSTANVNKNLPAIINGLHQTTEQSKSQQLLNDKVYWAEAYIKRKEYSTTEEKEAFMAERQIAFSNMQEGRDAKYQRNQLDMFEAVGNFGIEIGMNIAQGSRKNEKEKLEIQKALLCTQAVSNMVYGVVKAYMDYGYVYGTVIAALIIWACGVQISNINGCSFDGGGTVTIPQPSDYMTDANIMREPVTNIYVTGDVIDLKLYLSRILPDIKHTEKINVFKKPSELRQAA